MEKGLCLDEFGVSASLLRYRRGYPLVDGSCTG